VKPESAAIDNFDESKITTLGSGSPVETIPFKVWFMLTAVPNLGNARRASRLFFQALETPILICVYLCPSVVIF
jgi:hypothetical protein